jgi:hypothetical protein
LVSFSFSSASFFSFSYLSVSSFPAISSFFLISFLFRTFLDSFSWFLHFFSCFFLLSLTASFFAAPAWIGVVVGSTLAAQRRQETWIDGGAGWALWCWKRRTGLLRGNCSDAVVAMMD